MESEGCTIRHPPGRDVERTCSGGRAVAVPARPVEAEPSPRPARRACLARPSAILVDRGGAVTVVTSHGGDREAVGPRRRSRPSPSRAQDSSTTTGRAVGAWLRASRSGEVTGPNRRVLPAWARCSTVSGGGASSAGPAPEGPLALIAACTSEASGYGRRASRRAASRNRHVTTSSTSSLSARSASTICHTSTISSVRARPLAR